MSKRNIISLVFIIASLVCLYPGLTMDVLTIQVSASLPIIGNIDLYVATQSILGTIQELREQGNTLVGFLILLFSVLIPIFKAVSLLVVLFLKSFTVREKLYRFVALISKWSMADVFIVGVFLSFLAARSNDNINAWLHDGFYYFLAYCILSILATQIMEVPKEQSLLDE